MDPLTHQLSRNSILVAIGVVVIAAIVGTSLTPDHTVQILGFGSFICVSLLGLLQQVITAHRQEKATVEVKETLIETGREANEKLEAIAQTGHDTHALVNSGALLQYQLNAELSRWKADQTNRPEDIVAAEKAEKLYKEHKEKQAAVDAKSSNPQPVVIVSSQQPVPVHVVEDDK